MLSSTCRHLAEKVQKKSKNNNMLPRQCNLVILLAVLISASPMSCRHLVEKVNKKSKNNNVKPFMVKNHLWVFINTQVENPAFDSQVR
jgi:hypothetical protein